MYAWSGKKSWGKVTKFNTSDYAFPDKDFNRILSNPTFSFSAYHICFNLMSRDIDIISAGISIFDDLAIFCEVKRFFELEMKWFFDVIFYML